MVKIDGIEFNWASEGSILKLKRAIKFVKEQNPSVPVDVEKVKAKYIEFAGLVIPEGKKVEEVVEEEKEKVRRNGKPRVSKQLVGDDK